jgi:hypothetical protein
MRYIQHKGGQKLHLAFEIEDGLTHPVCGRVFDSYRASFNLPMGNACKKCSQRINSSKFNPNKFIKQYL